MYLYHISFLVFTISLQNKECVEIMMWLIIDIWHDVNSCSADYQRTEKTDKNQRTEKTDKQR